MLFRSVEGRNAEKPRLAYSEPFRDVWEHLLRQVTVVLLNALQNRDDVLLFAADFVDNCVNIGQLNAALYSSVFTEPLAEYGVGALFCIFTSR